MSERRPDREEGRAGFLMMDLLLALAVMALVAALALPFVRAGGEAALRVKSAEVAALLRSSRNAALLSGRPAIVTVDAGAGVVRSTHPAGTVVLPGGTTASLAPPGSVAITFTADGRASGGTILLAAGRARTLVRVNPLTAAVDVAGL